MDQEEKRKQSAELSNSPQIMNLLEEEFEQIQILPELSPQQSQKIEQQYHERLQKFYNKNKNYQIEHWYSHLQQFTSSSNYFSISAYQAYIIHCIYYQIQLSLTDQQILHKLQQKVDAEIEKMRVSENSKFFMKLSTRSPKDVCWDYRTQEVQKESIGKLVKYLERIDIREELNKCQGKMQKVILKNYLYRFFLENSKEKMEIRNSEDFMRIFSKSQRITSDFNDLSFIKGSIFQKIRKNSDNEIKNLQLFDYNICKQTENQPFINIWIRNWENCEWSEQFRLFYHDYKLTGISQYDQLCFFPQLPSQIETIKQQCLHFFNLIKPKLQQISLSQGVMDLIIKNNQNKVFLIQINVFDEDARASLFNWTKDKQILMNGPLTLRVHHKHTDIRKSQIASMMGMIEKDIVKVIEKGLEELKLLQIWNDD